MHRAVRRPRVDRADLTPAVHPQVEAVLRLQEGAPDLCDLGIDAVREQMRGLQARSGPPVAVGSVEEVAIPGPAGMIPSTVYAPEAASSAPRPVLLYLHGGGWVGGSRQSIDGTCRKLASWSGCLVVAPDYRLAPEHPFPAALHDVVAVARWLETHAAELGGDPDWLAAGGASSGANLAVSLALIARDDDAPTVRFLLLAYPPVDHAMDQASCTTYAEGFMLTTRSMNWFWSTYCADPSVADDPLVSPLRASSLAGLPTTHLLVAELDPLHDQVQAFGDRLEDDGVRVIRVTAHGMTHGFLGMSEMIDDADHHLREAAEALAAAAAAHR